MTKEREALKLVLEALDSDNPEIQLRAAIIIRGVLEKLAQPPEERNFCPRCGKRAGKNDWDVHTCSPPEENT